MTALFKKNQSINYTKPGIDGSAYLKLFLDASSEVVIGKNEQLQMAWCCILAGGHLLIEDLPGMGKTTMVKTIASLLDLPWKRIQCTSDMLPADITGGNVFNSSTNSFSFIKGPIFSNLVMADELNRASPKSQSAFLQAMEEVSVTVDGETHNLPIPFIVIATQNNLDSSGTNPLPESQLDRFMMSLSLGLPERESEKKLITSPPRADLIAEMKPVISREQLTALRISSSHVHIGDSVADYILDLVTWLRLHAHGVSPRTALALTACAKSWAFSFGRDFVMPSDVQAVAVNVLSHRVRPKSEMGSGSSASLVIKALKTVEVKN